MPKLPGVSHRRAVRAFKKAGFWIAHEGIHTNMTDGKNQVTIPRHNPVNAITMGGIINDVGLSIEQFKSLLK